MQIIERGTPTSPIAPAPQVSQTASSETPTPQPSPNAPGKTEPKSPELQRLEALARREQGRRKALEREAQERSQMSELQKQLQARESEIGRYKQFHQRFLQDPVSVLNEAGVHGDVITNSLINQPSREAVYIRQLHLQNQELQSQIRALTDRMDSSQKQALDTTKSQIKSDVKSLVEDSATPYEAIKANGSEAVEAVELLIEQTLEKEGRLMSVKEAADEVENYLIEEATKLAGLKKIQEKLAAQSNPSGQAVGRTQLGQSTLSNNSIPAPMARPRVSEKERIARAIAAFSQPRA